MVTLKEQLLDEISTKIIAYFVKNKFDARRNKTDGALSAEDFLVGLYNVLYKNKGVKYINVNNDALNYPGIDLVDSVTGTAVQVTVTEGIDKVKRSFDTISKSEDNEEYSTVIFFVQAMHLSSGHKKFGPDFKGYRTEVTGITELLKEISSLDDIDLLKEIHFYVKLNLVFPDVDISHINIDNAVFSVMFSALKNKSEEDYETSDEIYKTSPSEKKEKYADNWVLLIALYKQSLGVVDDEIDLHRLKNYRGLVEEVFSEDLDETQKESIQIYLRTQSLIILHMNNNDPVSSIHSLCRQLQDELKISFVPQSHILSFCLNMFFSCDVFPLISNQDEI